MGMQTPDDIQKMPDQQRRRLRLRKEFRHYQKQERPRLSPEDLLKYLRDREIRSSRILTKTRLPTDPTVNDFRREFKTWREAVQKALGRELTPVVDGDYVLKAVFDLGLWSVATFRAARKVDPVSVPSWRQVKKGWGTYRNLFECARRMNLKLLLEEYRKLYRKLGHDPTLSEIKEANLRMEEAIKFYGGKKELDKFVLHGLKG